MTHPDQMLTATIGPEAIAQRPSLDDLVSEIVLRGYSVRIAGGAIVGYVPDGEWISWNGHEAALGRHTLPEAALPTLLGVVTSQSARRGAYA